MQPRTGQGGAPRSCCAAARVGVAVLCIVLWTLPLPGQTVLKVANLRPPGPTLPTQPQRKILLRINGQALREAGGLTRLRFRLVRDLGRPLATLPSCAVIPTDTIPLPRLTTTGELDFGVLFRGKDLDLDGNQLRETVIYLVAEVAGVPGSELRVTAEDLKRYLDAGFRLVLRPPSGRPTQRQIRMVQQRLQHQRPIVAARSPCWRVTG